MSLTLAKVLSNSSPLYTTPEPATEAEPDNKYIVVKDGHVVMVSGEDPFEDKDNVTISDYTRENYVEISFDEYQMNQQDIVQKLGI